MVRIIGMSAMLHISFSLAALIFSVVLYVLICALGTGQVHKSLKFRTLTITVVFGNVISILDNIFRDAGIFPTPPAIQLLLLLLVYLANVLLLYYMALYMEGFFADFPAKKFFLFINTLLVISSIIFTAVMYSRQLMLYKGEMVFTTVPIYVRVLLGYAYELYFLIYSVTLFIIFNKQLTPRARNTAIAAFAVTIGGVLVELLNTFNLGSGILFNYFGAVIGLYIFYIGVETPDYRNLMQSITELDAARKSADEANHSKSDFLASMSHEIRTPINSVLGMNEMILREAEDASVLSYAENIRIAGETLLGLINDILDFSKIEAGKIEIIPVDYDIAAMINSLVNMIYTRADDKGLLLNLNFDRDMPRYLHGDEMRIKQIITNILTNAVKYTEKGSVTFNIGYEKIKDEPDSVLLNISVKDTGIGMKAEDLPKLFHAFERIDEKRNRKVEGTGLGMSITQNLLKLMGSGLHVESFYGEGSTFSFALKQKVVNWEALGDYSASYHEQMNNAKIKRRIFTIPDAHVLVVDDNPMNLMVFKSLMKQTRAVIDTAESGDESLVLAEKNRYDIIFLDHMMPGKDGIETLHELRGSAVTRNRFTPVICLTANAISGSRKAYLAEGFDDYLSKPIDVAILEDQLLKYIPKTMIHEPDDDDTAKSSANPSSGSAEAPSFDTARSTPAADTGHITGDGTACLSADTDGSISNPRPGLLPSLDRSVVDVESGIKSNGGFDTYLSVLSFFCSSIDKHANELDRLLESDNITDYTIKVHACKSSARIIGAFSLGDEALKLEEAGNAGDTDYIREHHRAFTDAWRSLKEPISKALKEEHY